MQKGLFLELAKNWAYHRIEECLPHSTPPLEFPGCLASTRSKTEKMLLIWRLVPHQTEAELFKFGSGVDKMPISKTIEKLYVLVRKFVQMCIRL